MAQASLTRPEPRSLSRTWLQSLADHLVPPPLPESALTFRDFQRATSPASWNVDYPHIAYLRDALQAVTDGSCRRLMIFMPPRHGKSESATVRYPLFRIERDPSIRCVIAAHTQSLATKFSRKALRIAQSRMSLAADRCAAPEWETLAGGGVRAVGVGGAIAGSGFDLLIIDDPVKKREEVEAEGFREKLWSWYTDDLYTRCEPGAQIILTMTRWHDDDLPGRILESDQASEWTVVNLPALAEDDDPLGREPGEALCPERYSVAALEDIRATQGYHSFDALYQQHPTSKEGAFFRVSQLRIVDEVPPGLPACRAWDQAATEGGGDWTAGVRIEGPDKNSQWYVTDVERGQWSTDKRNEKIKQTAARDGVGVKIIGATDPGSAGVDAGKAFVKMLAGYTVKTVRVTGSKTSRADPVSAQVNAGNVAMKRGEWNKAFKEELRTFPGGKFDDQVDGLADGFGALTGKKKIRAG